MMFMRVFEVGHVEFHDSNNGFVSSENLSIFMGNAE